MKVNAGNAVLVVATVLVVLYAIYVFKDDEIVGIGPDKFLKEVESQFPNKEEVLVARKFLLKLPKFPESDYSELNNLKIKEDAYLSYNNEVRGRLKEHKVFIIDATEKEKGFERLNYEYNDTAQNQLIKELIGWQLKKIGKRAVYEVWKNNIELDFKYKKELEEPTGEVIATWQEEVENQKALHRIRLIAYLNYREKYLFANDDFSRMCLKLSDTLTLYVRKEVNNKNVTLTYKLVCSKQTDKEQ